MLLFKYAGPDAAAKIFDREDSLSVRFGLPKRYNDPYELFLEPTPPLEDEEERAFYDYFLGEVLEAPVACFSHRPDSIVMWAHYGREGTGICLGFDEDLLVDQFPVAYVGDIEYSDGPATVDSGLVSFAFGTGKRRHTLRLLAVAHRAAYFMKRADWRYENERRIIVTPDAVEEYGDALTARITPRALQYIIVGPNVRKPIMRVCMTRARQWNVPILRLRIGARTYNPFFAEGAQVWAWDRHQFQEIDDACSECGEPSTSLDEDGRCQWCGISKAARRSAPRRSALTLTLRYGIDKGLPFVFEGMQARGRLMRESEAPQAPPNHRLRRRARMEGALRRARKRCSGKPGG